MSKKILLMFVSNDSGHHKAALALEKAFALLQQDTVIRIINAFNYLNPILEKFISKTYLGLIRKKPEFWGYLYDNPTIVKRTQKLRRMIHSHNTDKMRRIIESFSPNAIVCTQAFPCGIVADYKKSFNLKFGLYGVLTDYAPHSYWVYDIVDGYFVPSKETGDNLVRNGVPANKIIEAGIPIDPVFKLTKDKGIILKKYGLDSKRPIILLMGGSQGIGPLKEVFAVLARTPLDIQLLVLTGKNKGLYRWFKKQEKSLVMKEKSSRIFSYVDNIDELMEIATILISKPGGITTAEAFAKGVSLIIIKPIPGQERMNAEHLLKHNLAVKVNNPHDIGIIVEELLYNRGKLSELSEKARAFSRPESAESIARYVLANSPD